MSDETTNADQQTTAQLDPAAIALVRRTFLRQHIVRHLHPGVAGLSSRQGTTLHDPVRDILAFEELRQELESGFRERFPLATHGELLAFRERVATATSPERFFYGYSQQQLYRCVGVYRSGDDPKSALPELSDLVRRLNSEVDQSGILLVAGSGTGKTVAMWKVWFDCLFAWIDQTASSQPGDIRPNESNSPTNPDCSDEAVKLAGHVPCWLEPVHATEQLCQSTSALDFVLWILAASSGLVEFTSVNQGTLRSEAREQLLQRIRWQLTPKFCPPLLLFCDLNHISNRPIAPGSDVTPRTKFAEGLAEFQRQYGGHHRVIAAYRSQSQQDRAVNLLHQQFTAYDLQRLDRYQAVSYLDHLRRFEVSVYERLELDPPQRDVDRELRTLHDLISRTVREEVVEVVDRDESGNETRGFEKQTDPVISTPLLMHWVAQLRGEALSQVENITDLYREVVDRFLSRVRDQSDQGLDGETRQGLLVAMTRVALVLLAQDGETRAEDTIVREALQYPESGNGHWWPARFPLLQESAYCQQRFVKALIPRLLESGMFRRDETGLGFIHDSLIYYFAGALALHEYREPGIPTVRSTLPEAWSQEVSDLFTAQPGRWKLVAAFLSGALQRRQSKRQESSSPDSRRIMEELVLAKPHKEIPQLLTSFLRDQQSDPLLRQVQLAILDSSGFALTHHEALLQQVYNRLRWTVVEKEDSRETAARLLKRSRETATNRPAWVRLAKSRPTGEVLSMSDHALPINSVAILDDGRIVSGSDDHTVKVWNPETGAVVTMDEHKRYVNSVAVLDDGRIVSGSDDHTVKVWDPETGRSLDGRAHSVRQQRGGTR